jgi:hypothetical protein
LLLSTVCAEAFNPDEEEEDKDPRVKSLNLHHYGVDL